MRSKLHTHTLLLHYTQSHFISNTKIFKNELVKVFISIKIFFLMVFNFSKFKTNSSYFGRLSTKYLVLIVFIGGAYKRKFRVSSQRCGGVQRGLNPKWLLLSQHSRQQYCVAGSANYSGVGLWSLFRTKLNLRLWEIRGIFTESSRRVSRKPGGCSRALRRRSPTRHWRFIMRGVVAALRLETLYVKS